MPSAVNPFTMNQFSSRALQGAMNPMTYWGTPNDSLQSSYGQGYAYSGEGMPSWEQPQAPASTPGSFTSSYGGGSYTPRDTNIEDYWTGSGYSEIGSSKEYQPYDYSNQYQYGNLPTQDWANSNTYAPWSGYGPGGNEVTPGELSGYTDINNQARAESGNNVQNWLTGTGGSNSWLNTMGLGLFSTNKKKRSSPEFNAPSYQGMMFTPEEGFPSYYSPSQQTQNQTQQQVYDQSPYYEQPGATQGYDYNYTGGQNSGSLGTPTNPQQDFVGQQEDAYGSFYNPNRGGIYETFTV